MDRRIRILHVLGSLDPGGAERWILDVARRINQEQFETEVLTHRSSSGPVYQSFLARGNRVHQIPLGSVGLRYSFKLRALLQSRRFDVVHSHVAFFSALVLGVAKGAGVPVRIAHAHSTLFPSRRVLVRPVRSTYSSISRILLPRVASHLLAVSREAGCALFGSNEADSLRPWRTFYTGIDLRRFCNSPSKEAMRSELSIPRGRVVVGHVGSFRSQKNHRMMLEVWRALKRQSKAVLFVFVGDGALRKRIEGTVAKEGGQADFLFLGERPDVPRVLRAFDVFLFPSVNEGLPIAVLEAQAAGVPVLLSENVTEEVGVVPALVKRLSLDRPADDWAREIVRSAGEEAVSVSIATSLIENSPFNIDRVIEGLEALYGRTPLRSGP